MQASRNAAVACPSRDTLEAFSRGDLPLEQLECIGTHLGHCDRCALQLKSLAHATDALVSTLRLLAEIGEPHPDPASDQLEAAAKTMLPLDASAASDADWTMSIHLPDFEILGEIGRGGSGVVYRARQRSTGHEVALKRLPAAVADDPERLELFRNMVRLATGLENVGVVPVSDILISPGGPILVMPYIDGSDLGRLIANRSSVRGGARHAGRYAVAARSDAEYLEFVFPILDRVVAIVAIAHRAELFHGDIKPSNILVDGRGRPFLTDFGLARLVHGTPHQSTGASPATPGYLSPERWAGEEVDPRSDQFSLAACFYHVLTLTLPYGNQRLRHTTPPPLPARRLQPLLPRQLDAVLEKALAANPRARYATVQEFQEDWQRGRSGDRPNARPRGLIARLVRSLLRQ